MEKLLHPKTLEELVDLRQSLSLAPDSFCERLFEIGVKRPSRKLIYELQKAARDLADPYANLDWDTAYTEEDVEGLPLEITSGVHRHPLKLVKSPYRTDYRSVSYYCNVCYTQGDFYSYHCAKCQFDAHPLGCIDPEDHRGILSFLTLHSFWEFNFCHIDLIR